MPAIISAPKGERRAGVPGLHESPMGRTAASAAEVPFTASVILTVLCGEEFRRQRQNKKAGAFRSRPKPSLQELKNYLPPNPVACIAFFDISLVDEMPCMRSLKSSAFDAFSSAVS